MATNVKPFAPGVMEYKFGQTLGEDVNIFNRLFFTFTGTMGTTDAQSIALVGGTSWTNWMRPNITPGLILTSVTVTDLSSAAGVVGVQAENQPGTGQSTGALPANCCIMMRASPSRRYRGGKPRWYQSGTVDGMLADPQTWTTGTVAQWDTSFNGFIGELGGATSGTVALVHNVNLSYVEGHTWTPVTTAGGVTNYRRDPVYRAAVQTDLLSQWTTYGKVASQRRRVRMG